jgi:hypothetical protein
MSYLFVSQLLELTHKKVCREYLEYVWKRKFDWDEQKTKSWLVENQQQLEQNEAEWKEEKNYRLNIIKKYLYNEETSKEIKPNDSTDDNITGIRYIDNQVVTTKGEKYVIKKEGEEWDGGSRGKVKTKGKRGKGFV